MLKRKIEKLVALSKSVRDTIEFFDYDEAIVSEHIKLYGKLNRRIKFLTAIKTILDYTIYFLFGTGDLKRTSVDDNICDYSGQGRDKYGN